MKGIEQAQRLARLLRVRVKAAGLELGATSLRLGLSRGYLGRILHQPAKLKVKHVYAALEVLDLHPAAFFADLYRRPLPRMDLLPELPILVARLLAGPPAVDPRGEQRGPGEVARLAQLLSLKVLATGTTQRAVSQALGFLPDHLSQILRGEVDLKVWHVYGALEEMGLDPADFFDELYGMAGGLADVTVPGGRRWSEVLRSAREGKAAIERRRAEPGFTDRQALLAALAERLLAEAEAAGSSDEAGGEDEEPAAGETTSPAADSEGATAPKSQDDGEP